MAEHMNERTLIPMTHGEPTDLRIAVDLEKRRLELGIRAIELANAFDDLDHQFGPMGGTDLQHDCQKLREFVRGGYAAE